MKIRNSMHTSIYTSIISKRHTEHILHRNYSKFKNCIQYIFYAYNISIIYRFKFQEKRKIKIRLI